MLTTIINWLSSLLGLRRADRREQPAPPPAPLVVADTPPPRTIVPLLIYPAAAGDLSFDQFIDHPSGRYYTSSPWEVDASALNPVIAEADSWMSSVLGRRIPWNEIRVIRSDRSLEDWRNRGIGLLPDEARRAGLPWTREYIYTGWVRGMGGYAGGIAWNQDRPGYAMLGDASLEAVLGFPDPNAASSILATWPESAYRRTGQTGSFIHETLHGLDLPHPDGWPEGNRPRGNQTIMGEWWLHPAFRGTHGLTRQEVDKVMRWLESVAG